MKFKGQIIGWKNELIYLKIMPEDMPEVKKDISKYVKNIYEIIFKKPKPKVTNPQIRLYWKTLNYFAHALGLWDEESIKYLHEGIKEKYGYKKSTDIKDKTGDYIKVPMGLSECNRFEEFEALFEGIFLEACDQGIDMGEYIKEWEKIRKEMEVQNAKTSMRQVQERNDSKRK